MHINKTTTETTKINTSQTSQRAIYIHMYVVHTLVSYVFMLVFVSLRVCESSENYLRCFFCSISFILICPVLVVIDVGKRATHAQPFLAFGFVPEAS